jgi:hypothetical protein
MTITHRQTEASASQRHFWIVGGVIFAFLVACQSTGSTEKRKALESEQALLTNQNGKTQQALEKSDEDLLNLAKEFATSDSRRREQAWNSLSSYERASLTTKLAKLRDNVTGVDRIAIAFLLCNLDFEYDVNRNLIVAAVKKEPHHENLHADWEAELIARLIKRGDKSLMPVLFEVASWSDGALAEDLSSIFEQQLTRDAASFIAKLSSEPKKTRADVYAHFDDESFSLEDIMGVLDYLNSGQLETELASRDRSRDRVVIKELVKTLSEIKSRLMQKSVAQPAKE